ncbi:MAG: hypothetical protein OXO50_09375 [Caldilineaceae bacterium]|nr:hypothetical protein [Caldilineaceae bacterium]
MSKHEDWIDGSSFSLFKQLKLSTVEEQVDNAIAAIDLLKDEASRHFSEGSEPFRRWQRGCDELWESVDGFLAKSRVYKVDAFAILEEFIDSLEHTEKRFHQILYIDSISEADRGQIIEQTWNWFSVILRFALYALVLEYRSSQARGEQFQREQEEGTDG